MSFLHFPQGQNGFYGYLDYAPRLAFTADISNADTFRVDSKGHLYGGGNKGDNYAQTYYGEGSEYGIIFENNNSSAVASKLVAQADGSCHLVLSPTFDTTSTKLYQCAGCDKGVHCAWFNSVRQARCGALQLVVESVN